MAGVMGVSALVWLAPAATAGASTTTGQADVTVTVVSSVASAGDVEVANQTGSTVYSTCSAAAAGGTMRCVVPVPPGASLAVIAQPAAGDQLTAWAGGCEGTPGPVCHLEAGTAGSDEATKATIDAAPAGTPVLSTSAVYKSGRAGGCSSGQGLKVSGTGLPPNTKAYLADDGTQVASAKTDANGNVTLTDPASAPSEPGVYRTLTVTAGSASATTDVINEALACIAYAVGGGTMTIYVAVTGMDANSSSVYIKVIGQAPVTVATGADGSGTAQTPNYTCTPNQTYRWFLEGVRGAGTKQQYTFRINKTITCQ